MAWACGLLCFLGTRFADAALERRYLQFRMTDYFLKDDVFQAGLRLAMVCFAVVRELLKHGPTAAAAGVLSLLACGPLLQLALRWQANQRGRTEPALTAYLWQRSAWATISRVVLYPLFVCPWILGAFPTPGASATWGELASYVLNGSGALAPLVESVAYAVPLEHHLAIQPLMALMMAYRQEGPFCEAALSADSGPRHVLAAWRAIEAASRWVLAAMYMAEVPAPPEPDPLPACRHVVLALHVCVGLAVATYVAWLAEHASRVHFLAAAGRGEWMGWRRLGGPALLFQLVMGVGCLAVAWQVLGVLLLNRPPVVREGGGGGGDVG